MVPFLGTLNIRCRSIIGIQKRDHNFDNHPCTLQYMQLVGFGAGLDQLRRSKERSSEEPTPP